jgi:hypothetical protein
MNWLSPVDIYCERTGPEYWSEPVNALTNAAFIIAAFIMWRRVQGPRLRLARAMCGVLAAIGVGSWLFHTHANGLTGLLDVLPILGFILLYIHAANRAFLGVGRLASVAIALAFVPVSALLSGPLAALPVVGVSASYIPVALLILCYAALLARRQAETARGLAIGGGILIVSITARSIDQPLCAALPMGTHFLWHVLNGVMLGWMIEVYRRHQNRRPKSRARAASPLAARGPGG